MLFWGIIPLPVIFMIFSAYLIALLWGQRGPRRYRRDRFFTMKGKDFQAESEESLEAGQLLDEGVLKVSNRSELQANEAVWKRRDIQFRYSPRFYIHGEMWSYYVSQTVQQSRSMVDYARIIKLLGAMSLDLSPNIFQRILRQVNMLVWLALYVTAFVMVYTAIETQPYGRPNLGTPWEQLNTGTIVLFCYMIFRFGAETIQYLMQIHRSKRMIKDLAFFQSERTVDLIHKYLHRQFFNYIVSYLLVIFVFFILTAMTIM
ncbi:hypothetical protein [Gracilibacillus alcaliphilus]|uniref:hypothetical protein n=1 Tax=Gracilibacillus alcaliphilus TaxID=1401441 RepID=UPI00195EFA72|nr:hypothetical protein [Gracilibacillus alcaliphilus]MBM7675834.1 hypothetical protein [Gracilibacillus alcaliphilus]